MTSKLRVKYGQLEVEFEGSEDFIKSDLKSFIESLPVEHVAAAAAAVAKDKHLPSLPAGGTMTTSMIAQKVGGDTGPKLVIAALARLVLVLKQTSASRKEILKEMQ